MENIKAGTVNIAYDRPSHKANDGDAQPPYTEAQIAARKDIGARIVALIQENAEAIGAFLTPNNKFEGEILAVTLPCPPVHFTDPLGEAKVTRQFNLSINAPLAKEEKSGVEPAHQQIAMSLTEMRAKIAANRRK